jgi:hypothetical protein
MKNFMKLVLVGAGVMALTLVGCEPGGGDSDAETAGSSSTTSTTGEGATDTTGEDGTVTGTGGVDEYAVLEMVDDTNNPTISPNCDTGSLKSPGADIDAAELIDPDDSILANLTGCNLTGVTECESTAENPADAEGTPNSDGTENTDQYVALNGGTLRCAWADGQLARSGDTVQVYEVGGSGGTKVEQYTIRLCKNTGGNCTKDAAFASGDSAFPIDTLL